MTQDFGVQNFMSIRVWCMFMNGRYNITLDSLMKIKKSFNQFYFTFYVVFHLAQFWWPPSEEG